MKLKHIIWILVLFVLIPSVSSANNFTVDLHEYFTFNNDTIIAPNITTGYKGIINISVQSMNTNVATNTLGLIGDTLNFNDEPSHGHFKRGGSDGIIKYTESDVWSVNFWFLLNHTTKDNTLHSPLGGDGPTNDDDNVRIDCRAGNQYICVESSAPGAQCSSPGSFICEAQRWYMLTIVHNASSKEMHLYLNGTYFDSFTFTHTNITWGVIGTGYIDSNQDLFGKIDELGFWNRSFDLAEVVELYNNSKGLPIEAFDGGGTSQSFMSFTTDWLNGSDIAEFHLKIDVGANSYIFNTTNGTINTNFTNNASIIYNVTYYDLTCKSDDCTYDNRRFYNRSFTAVNFTYDHNSTQHSGEVTFIVTKKISNVTITGGLLNYTYGQNLNTLEFINGSWMIAWNHTGYYNRTTIVNIGNHTGSYPAGAARYLDNYTHIIDNVYTSRVNLTAASSWGETIFNFSINVTIINSSYSYSEIFTTTNGTACVTLIEGNFTFIIDGAVNNPQYPIDSVNLSVSGYNQSYQFILFTTNSFNILFKDEERDLILDWINISIEFISDYSSNGTFYTTNGTHYIDLLTPAEYTIRYDSSGHSERFYFVELINQTSTNITLYLLNKTNSANITITVLDTMNRKLEDALIKIYRYYIESNSYKLISMTKTDFEGKAHTDMVLHDEYYKFKIYYNDILEKTTDPLYIYDTLLQLIINLGEGIGENYYKTQSVTHSLDFTNSSHRFRYEFDDDYNAVTKGCLRVYELDYTGKTLINSSCTESTSGIIFITVENGTGRTYLAKGYITLSGVERLLSSYIFTYPESSEELGDWGWFMVIILTILLSTAGFWNATVGVILAPWPLFIGSLIGIIPLSIGITLPIVLICLVVAYIIADHS